ncbi:MAG: SRPBCC family protein [Ginsengibacter sp.]
MSKIYSLKTIQILNVPLDEAWSFFSSPKNLAAITPSNLGFKITSKYHGDIMYEGQIIQYIVKPVLGIPLNWLTEITHVEQGKFFIDEQRFGPYSFWHHQHHFKPHNSGTEMTDIVHYKLPLWFLGDIANSLFVEGQLKTIFDYRYNKADELFNQIT